MKGLKEYSRVEIVEKIRKVDLDGLRGIEEQNKKYLESRIYNRRNFIRDYLDSGGNVSKLCKEELGISRADLYRFSSVDHILWVIITYFNRYHKHCNYHKRITS